MTEGLGLSHLHLVTGTSMGGMHSWLWGYLYPTFMDALVPLASNPVEIAGRNRMWRKMLVDAIVTDPTWKNGDYTEPPRNLASAHRVPDDRDERAAAVAEAEPDGQAGRRWLADQIANRTKSTDANDMIYYFRASEDYNPAPHLAKITAPLLAINSADDFVNPPELPMMEALIKQVPRGRFILLPITDQTRGHGTHTLPAIWGAQVARVSGDGPEMMATDGTTHGLIWTRRIVARRSL